MFSYTVCTRIPVLPVSPVEVALVEGNDDGDVVGFGHHQKRSMKPGFKLGSIIVTMSRAWSTLAANKCTLCFYAAIVSTRNWCGGGRRDGSGSAFINIKSTLSPTAMGLVDLRSSNHQFPYDSCLQGLAGFGFHIVPTAGGLYTVPYHGTKLNQSIGGGKNIEA